MAVGRTVVLWASERPGPLLALSSRRETTDRARCGGSLGSSLAVYQIRIDPAADDQGKQSGRSPGCLDARTAEGGSGGALWPIGSRLGVNLPSLPKIRRRISPCRFVTPLRFSSAQGGYRPTSRRKQTPTPTRTLIRRTRAVIVRRRTRRARTARAVSVGKHLSPL